MQLNETVNLMNSDDYQDRFKAEHAQVCIRIDGLEQMMYQWKMDKLNFEPKCSKELLVAQLSTMQAYACLLEERARIEKISL